MTRSRLALRSATALLAALAPLAVAPAAPAAETEAAPTAPALLTVSDPGFEAGGSGWEFTPGTGTAVNYPHAGARLAYLDAGSGMKVSQTVTAAGHGSYAISAWIATGGPGGRYVLRVNGSPAASLDLPAAAQYRRHTLGPVTLAPATAWRSPSSPAGAGSTPTTSWSRRPPPRTPGSPPATLRPARCSPGPPARRAAGSTSRAHRGR
ncbi:hypothetical protein SLA_7032 [Streptomyces laurentii]|uniref:Uncharacterized protein n=1 Tax=Streptomyces laurentii TaxID=39478 RepID=A0A169PHY5_STRLU|nr:hypothetical protein SLA_7032 [Streptomyces laurentii]